MDASHSSMQKRYQPDQDSYSDQPSQNSLFSAVERVSGLMNVNAGLLADGKRLHLQEGPIDLIIEADGEEIQIVNAYCQAIECFSGLLSVLVNDLEFLRSAISINSRLRVNPIALQMAQAVMPYQNQFVTPMAAVAGAVADHVMAALVRNRDLVRAYVNNGGDIAYHFGPGSFYKIGICTNPEIGTKGAEISICANDNIHGLATSGWRGRSHSLGIADSVTVLANTAVEADVAATMIANAVDLPDSLKIERIPARTLSLDSDLGDQLVTTNVAPLEDAECCAALYAGASYAEDLLSSNLITGVYLNLQGQSRIVANHSMDVMEPEMNTKNNHDNLSVRSFFVGQ